MRVLVSLLLLAVPTFAQTDLPMCATSDANDARLRALHERTSMQLRIAEQAVPSVPELRDGSFYIDADDKLVPGYRPFDLEGQSLTFTPGGSGYVVTRGELQYIDPTSEPLHDFQTTPAGSPHYIEYIVFPGPLPPPPGPGGIPPVIFGTARTTLYLSAYNSIHLTPPAEQAAAQFDDLEAAVYREPLLSPLLITKRKPSRLHYPRLYVQRYLDNLVITWRSATGSDFGYDVQVHLHIDGSFVFSYRSVRNMRWGAAVVSTGFDPATATRRTIGFIDDVRNDLVAGTFIPSLADVSDLARVEVVRINETDLLAVRLKLQGALDITKLAEGQSLRYVVQIGTVAAWLDIDRKGWTFTPFNAAVSIANGPEVRIDGDVIEMFGVPIPADAAPAALSVIAWSVVPSTNRTIDFAARPLAFDAPVKRIATDLSSLQNGIELSLPITEPFVLGELDPLAVWARLQSSHALNAYETDAVAIYQTFFTDLIFYAGAYSTGGNPAVDGIAPPSSSRGSKVPRGPALMHMNQLTYGWNMTERNSSSVMLHELGHRWLYFFRINEGGQVARVLNPVSAHPAGNVHTPSAFRVFGDDECSVMGGASFAAQSDGRYRAHVAFYGYSWTDLYLMGLAAPEEVQPWFYIANASPSLPKEYNPPDGVVVSGDRRQVSVDQIIAAEGPRNPPASLSQRSFRVVFVLITDAGGPANEQVAKIEEWRTLLETTFSLAVGGRARITTEWVRATGRRRSVR